MKVADMTATDMIFIAQEMASAATKYRESVDRLTRLQTTPGQFANAISGQRQMADICDEIARKAKALRGFDDEVEVITDLGEPAPLGIPYPPTEWTVRDGRAEGGERLTHDAVLSERQGFG